jgi:hypothetical protein
MSVTELFSSFGSALIAGVVGFLYAYVQVYFRNPGAGIIRSFCRFSSFRLSLWYFISSFLAHLIIFKLGLLSWILRRALPIGVDLNSINGLFLSIAIGLFVPISILNARFAQRRQGDNLISIGPARYFDKLLKLIDSEILNAEQISLLNDSVEMAKLFQFDRDSGNLMGLVQESCGKSFPIVKKKHADLQKDSEMSSDIKSAVFLKTLQGYVPFSQIESILNTIQISNARNSENFVDDPAGQVQNYTKIVEELSKRKLRLKGEN